jgi:hypothetical protein
VPAVGVPGAGSYNRKVFILIPDSRHLRSIRYAKKKSC